MSDRGSSYENLYTKQIFEAVSNQPEHEAKREAEKQRIKQNNEDTKRNFRAFGWLMLAGFLGACGYLINLDPDNAGPCAAALVVFLLVGGFVYFWNK